MVNHITVHPTIHFGKPCVAGGRVTVQRVLEPVVSGLLFDRIIRNCHPDLTADDIHACIRYAIALAACEEIQIRAASA